MTQIWKKRTCLQSRLLVTRVFFMQWAVSKNFQIYVKSISGDTNVKLLRLPHGRSLSVEI